MSVILTTNTLFTKTGVNPHTIIIAQTKEEKNSQQVLAA